MYCHYRYKTIETLLFQKRCSKQERRVEEDMYKNKTNLRVYLDIWRILPKINTVPSIFPERCDLQCQPSSFLKTTSRSALPGLLQLRREAATDQLTDTTENKKDYIKIKNIYSPLITRGPAVTCSRQIPPKIIIK